MRKFARTFAALVGIIQISSSAARADDLSITTYGGGPQGYPYAVALAKGYFKEFGADVTGFLSSTGGGTTIRNLISGKLAYGEANLTAVVLAIREGADIKIISGTTYSPGSAFFATRKDSDIKSIKDLKGKKIAYTVPGSSSHALALKLIDAAGLKAGDVELVKTGGLGEGIVALDKGLIDVAPFFEPAWTANRSKYQLLIPASDFLTAFTGEVGITTGAAAKSRPEFIKAVIRARAKAIDFMRENPKEASEIIARDFKMEPELIRQSMQLLFDGEQKSGYPYFSRGELDYPAMENVVDAQKQTGALTNVVDWTKIVDDSFLTPDMKTRSKLRANK